jgi:hypothetical protein
MEKIINLLIKEFIEGVDTYTHNGSTWLIYTESKQWVIELTKEKTLWYNYNFFKEIFEYTSMDVVENQHHITKWVEDTIINEVKEIYDYKGHRWEVKDVIKETIECDWNIPKYVINEVVDDGVKETNHVDVMGFFNNKMEDTLQNGIKETNSWNDSIIGDLNQNGCIDNVIENGVKETKVSNYCGDNTEFIITDQWIIDRVIENGVKEIRPSGCVDPKTGIFHYRIQEQVDDVVDNGEKVNGTFVGGKRQKENIESVIGYGTKNPTD